LFTVLIWLAGTEVKLLLWQQLTLSFD